ncbi:MAG TPA: hypothetical protein VK616_02240, partial [Flavitalea sp.]|nr:hypothetical protein [Flavitalea sp.]
LHNVAFVNDILTIVASSKMKLYADSISIDRIKRLVRDVVKRYSADTSKFVVAGYGEAGNIALRYTELSYENPSQYKIQPKAVFGIDAPVDLTGFWRWSESSIKKNFWQGEVGDAKYYLDVMKKDNGSPAEHPEKYKLLSPFNRANDEPGNEKFLQKIPVRLYYDGDIQWQLKERRNSFYDTKMADGSELIKRLLLSGNEKAELVISAQPGRRSDGTRHPSAMSIVDEVDCIQWIKGSLGIFDARTWQPPYHLLIPEGWSIERFALPPDFAPKLTCKGVEDIRFAPGWGDTTSDEHWTYGFLWWLSQSAKVDAGMLQDNLREYFNGLVQRNLGAIDPASDMVKTNTSVKKIKTAGEDIETFAGSISMFDYHTKKRMVLNCLIHLKKSIVKDRVPIFFEMSPKNSEHPVWKKLHEIEKSLRIIN